MFQYFSTILYVHFRNSRDGKLPPRVGNPSAPHPLNKSLCDLSNVIYSQYSYNTHDQLAFIVMCILINIHVTSLTTTGTLHRIRSRTSCKTVLSLLTLSPLLVPPSPKNHPKNTLTNKITITMHSFIPRTLY